jgi:hypothetical protein
MSVDTMPSHADELEQEVLEGEGQEGEDGLDEAEAIEVGPKPAEEPEEEEAEEPDEESEEAESDTDIPAKMAAITSNEEFEYYSEELQGQKDSVVFLLEQAKAADPAFLKEAELPRFNYRWNNAPANIYKMDDDEFEAFADALSETEVVSKADYRKVVAARGEYLRELKAKEKESAQLLNNLDLQEWALIEQSVPKAVRDQSAQIREWLNKKLASEPAFIRRLQTVKGKLQAVNLALKALKVEGKLATKEKKAEKPLPVVHSKAKGSSAKATPAPAFTRKQIADMTIEEYQKNAAAIEAAERAGRIK